MHILQLLHGWANLFPNTLIHLKILTHFLLLPFIKLPQKWPSFLGNTSPHKCLELFFLLLGSFPQLLNRFVAIFFMLCFFFSLFLLFFLIFFIVKEPRLGFLAHFRNRHWGWIGFLQSRYSSLWPLRRCHRYNRLRTFLWGLPCCGLLLPSCWFLRFQFILVALLYIFIHLIDELIGKFNYAFDVFTVFVASLRILIERKWWGDLTR